MKGTLEEAAEQYSQGWGKNDDVKSFIAGGKHMAERMYSKKEVMDMFDTFSMYLPLHYKFLLEEELKKD